MLRNAYAGRAPVFDLAAVEATLPDGRTNTFNYQGREFFALARVLAFDALVLRRFTRRYVAPSAKEALA